MVEVLAIWNKTQCQPLQQLRYQHDRKIKLVHSSGNAVSIAIITSNPSSSEVEFKLPQADGTSGQALVTDASGNLCCWKGRNSSSYTPPKTDAFTTTSQTYVDLMTATITLVQLIRF